MSHLYGLILAGGRGTRFWPRSRRSHAKQVLRFFGERTLIQQTVDRLLSVQTSAEQPGMLLGKIQSGKTKTFLGAIALAFDNGFDIPGKAKRGQQPLAALVKSEIARWTPIIKAANIKGE